MTKMYLRFRRGEPACPLPTFFEGSVEGVNWSLIITQHGWVTFAINGQFYRQPLPSSVGRRITLEALRVWREYTSNIEGDVVFQCCVYDLDGFEGRRQRFYETLGFKVLPFRPIPEFLIRDRGDDEEQYPPPRRK